MTYRFKLNTFKQPVTLCVVDQRLEVLNDEQEVVRQIRLRDIRKIREYDGFKATDPVKGSYSVKYCKLYTNGQPALHIRNGSPTGSDGKLRDTATNQDEAYQRFLTELKGAVSHINPKNPFTTGWLLASTAWWLVALLGMVFFAFGIGGFLMDEFTTALFIALFCFGIGTLLIISGVSLGRNYWPKSTTPDWNPERKGTRPR